MISSKILENGQGTFWKIILAGSLLLLAQCMLSTLCKVLVDPFPFTSQISGRQLGLVHEELQAMMLKLRGGMAAFQIKVGRCHGVKREGRVCKECDSGKARMYGTGFFSALYGRIYDNLC